MRCPQMNCPTFPITMSARPTKCMLSTAQTVTGGWFRCDGVLFPSGIKSLVVARRCLIPATGFFEWTKTQEGQRLPWYITHRNAEPLAFAGVWQSWGQGEQQQKTCAIVTTSANAKMQALHHRVPVVLSPQDWPLWLGEAGKGAARLMQPLADGALCFHRVDTAVNSNRASGPKLIETISA